MIGTACLCSYLGSYQLAGTSCNPSYNLQYEFHVALLLTLLGGELHIMLFTSLPVIRTCIPL